MFQVKNMERYITILKQPVKSQCLWIICHFYRSMYGNYKTVSTAMQFFLPTSTRGWSSLLSTRIRWGTRKRSLETRRASQGNIFWQTFCYIFSPFESHCITIIMRKQHVLRMKRVCDAGFGTFAIEPLSVVYKSEPISPFHCCQKNNLSQLSDHCRKGGAYKSRAMTINL